MDAEIKPMLHKRGTFRLRNFLSTPGPGLMTSASDDDPSGIGTYSQARRPTRLRDRAEPCY